MTRCYSENAAPTPTSPVAKGKGKVEKEEEEDEEDEEEDHDMDEDDDDDVSPVQGPNCVYPTEGSYRTMRNLKKSTPGPFCLPADAHVE